MEDKRMNIDMRRELAVDESKHPQYQTLADTEIFKNFDAPMKEVFIYAMALGFHNKNPVPLRKKKFSIPTRALSDSQLWLIKCLAIAKKQNLEVLFDVNDVLNMAEEYANGGIQELYDTVTKPSAGDSYKLMDQEVSECMRRQFDKKPESMREKPQVLLTDLHTLIRNGENENVEFKSSLMWDYKNHNTNKALGMVIAKSMVCFLNSRKGGKLLIGVSDDKSILGLENDFKNSPLRKGNEDGFQLKIIELIDRYIGKLAHPFIHVKFENLENKTICIIEVEKSSTPMYLNNDGKNEFYARTGNSCQQLDAKDSNEWIRTNWSG
jgi:hypothetical protein